MSKEVQAIIINSKLLQKSGLKGKELIATIKNLDEIVRSVLINLLKNPKFKRDFFEDPLIAIKKHGFEDPLTAFEDPLTAIKKFEDPLIAFEDPLIARKKFEDPLTASKKFEDPLIAFEDPLIARKIRAQLTKAKLGQKEIQNCIISLNKIKEHGISDDKILRIVLPKVLKDRKFKGLFFEDPLIAINQLRL